MTSELRLALGTIERLARERRGSPSEVLDRIAGIAGALAPKGHSSNGKASVQPHLANLVLTARAAGVLLQGLRSVYSSLRWLKQARGESWSLQDVESLRRAVVGGFAGLPRCGPVLADEIDRALAAAKAGRPTHEVGGETA